MSSEEIINFVRVDERVATAGQPTKEQLHALRDEGYEAIINLLPVTQDNALKEEAEIVRALGLEYHYIPVVWTDPRTEDFTAFCKAMEQAQGKKLLVHCAMNLRVTAFFSAYGLRYLGWDKARADELVNQAWRVMPDDKRPEVWRAYITKIRE